MDTGGLVPNEFDRAIDTADRIELWSGFLQSRGPVAIAEIGVYRGEFAEAMLLRCPKITDYYMLDPWRHLDDWNKPANQADETFAAILREATDRTEAWAAKRIMLRGRTAEVAQQLPDAGLDFAYIDGDHTLRGITIDLLHIWPKLRTGGVIGGDDFTASVWQHDRQFEPTMVFPYAVYFAEAVGAPIEALPHDQFALHKDDSGFAFHDRTGRYQNTTVGAALQEQSGRLARIVRRLVHFG